MHAARNLLPGFTAFFIFLAIFFLVCGVWSIKDGYFPSHTLLARYPDSTDSFWIFHRLGGPIFLMAAILPAIVSCRLLGRKLTKATWILGLLSIPLAFFTGIGLIMIVALVLWCLPSRFRLFFPPSNATLT
jgi:hypothetical protein